jgi:hypothetical protein
VNRKQREAAKASQEARKQHRSSAAETAALIARDREAGIARALAKPPPTAYSRLSWHHEHEATFAEVVIRKAPKLAELHYKRALSALSTIPHVRPVTDWVPDGKGRTRLFRSLCEHLLAKYPVPPLVWSALTDEDNRELIPLAVHVAAGGSLYAYVKDHFCVPLTRKMCHELLATPSDVALVEAMRRVQARAAGVDGRFFQAWWATRTATVLQTKEDETFWFTVLEWFGHVQMLDPAQVGPLYDYIDYRRREDKAFTMKGRTIHALMRDMREWHATLRDVRIAGKSVYLPSGFAETDHHEERKDGNATVHEIWRVREVLTAKRLAEEGRLMGHCVYSYGWSIEKGNTSIWSVTMEDGRGATGNWHMVTLEVRNLTKTICQARGRFNRKITHAEYRVIHKWATENGLVINVGF